jgi:hypothetical protein
MRIGQDHNLSIRVEFRMIADNSKHDIPREDTHDIAQRLNKFLLLTSVIELAD